MVDSLGHVGMALAPSQRRRRKRMPPLFIQLLEESYSDIDEYESEEDDGVTRSIGANDLTYIFRDEHGFSLISLMSHHHLILIDVGTLQLFMKYSPPYYSYENFSGLHYS